MKQLLSLFIALTLVLSAHSQNLDDGVSPLSIGADLTNLGGLKSIEKEDLWNPVLGGDYMDFEYYTFSVNGFKVNSFFGLDIDRVEIASVSWTNDEDKKVEEIHQFTLLIEDPGSNAYKTFIAKVEEAYGVILTYSIDEETWTESPNWFSETTLLTVSGDEHRTSHDGKKYIMVQFRSGVGG